MNSTNNNQTSISLKKWLILIAFVLFSILLIGGFYLFNTPGQTVNFAFAYAVGLSMIVLPCTLPLAFVIVPLAMKENPKKGLLMALFFGLGLSITLAIYGIFVALIGKVIGLDSAMAGAGSVSKILFIIGGLAAFVFGLSELNLIKFKTPGFSGAYPGFIQKQKDYFKAFLLGLFLGNAGVGCPNPLFYVLLGDIAVIGNIVNGGWLGFIHGIGRATPLIFLAILGLLGVNAISDIAKKASSVKKITGIALIILGAFIFISGTSHQWYENSMAHRGWNKVVNIIVGDQISEIEDHDEEPGTPTDHGREESREEEKIEEHEEAPGTPADHGHEDAHEEETANAKDEAEHAPDYIPAPWSWITLLLLIITPLIWYKLKKDDENKQ